MIRRADIRFTANSASTASAARLILPVRVLARHASHQQALAAARGVFDAFAKHLLSARHEGGALSLGELTVPVADAAPGLLTIQQRSPKEAQVEVEFMAVLQFTGPTDFWRRAEVVVWAVDFVQSFSQRAWPKGTWVIPRRGRFLADAPATEETVGDPESE
jgi:hypothetical protein